MKVNQLLFEDFVISVQTLITWPLQNKLVHISLSLNSHEVQGFLSGSWETRRSYHPHATLKDAKD